MITEKQIKELIDVIKMLQILDKGKEDPVDRIRSLPDLVLSQILSYLPIEAAIQTRILAKHWRNLWFPTREELVFHQTCQRTDLYLKGIANFIDCTIPLDTCPKITKFELQLTSDKYIKKKLLRLLLRCKILGHVKDVILDLRDRRKTWDEDRCRLACSYFLYEQLCSYPSLERLTLRRIDIDPSLKISWTSLKALTKSYVLIKNNVITNIIQGCPKLDQLELNECYDFDHINVSSTSCLRKLIVFQSERSPYFRPEQYISVPKVECLVLKVFENVQLLDISSLVDVSIDFYSLESYPYFALSGENKYKKHTESDWLFRDERTGDYIMDRRDILMELLNSVSQIETIRLGPWCVEVVSSYILRGMFFKLPSLKCKCLVVETPVEEWDIPGIVGLLRSSAHLETLVMDLTTEDNYDSKFSIGTKVAATDANIYWNKQKNFFTKKQFKELKNVTIVGLSVRLVDFAKVLLEKAKSLEKMELTKTRTKEHPSLIVDRIVHLPRASHKAQISIC